jgi:hypothetical protein
MKLSWPLYFLLLITAAAFRLPANDAETWNPRIEYLRTMPSVREFTKPHGWLSRIVSWVAGPDEDKPELLRPYATAQDSKGRLLVTDPGMHGVHIFDFEGKKYQF